MRTETGRRHGLRSVMMLLCATAVAAAVVVASWKKFGAGSAWFALVVVWVPMAWLGTIGRVALLRLPDRYHRLRSSELDGRVYEAVGVRVFKTMLRRGPLAVFNPDLHIPAERTVDKIEHLDQRMRDAEASHLVLFVATFAVIGHALLRSRWWAAGWTALFNLVLNGYPVMLQRYNRALLARRFPSAGRA